MSFYMHIWAYAAGWVFLAGTLLGFGYGIVAAIGGIIDRLRRRRELAALRLAHPEYYRRGR